MKYTIISFMFLSILFILITGTVSHSQPSAPLGLEFKENIWGNFIDNRNIGIDGIQVVLKSDDKSIALTTTNAGGYYTFGMWSRGKYIVVPTETSEVAIEPKDIEIEIN